MAFPDFMKKKEMPAGPAVDPKAMPMGNPAMADVAKPPMHKKHHKKHEHKSAGRNPKPRGM